MNNIIFISVIGLIAADINVPNWSNKSPPRSHGWKLFDLKKHVVGRVRTHTCTGHIPVVWCDVQAGVYRTGRVQMC